MTQIGMAMILNEYISVSRETTINVYPIYELGNSNPVNIINGAKCSKTNILFYDIDQQPQRFYTYGLPKILWFSESGTMPVCTTEELMRQMCVCSLMEFLKNFSFITGENFIDVLEEISDGEFRDFILFNLDIVNKALGEEQNV